MTMSPGLKGGNELLLDIGAEAFAVDGAVKDARGGKAVRRSAPRKVSVRQWPCGAKPEPLALRSPSPQRRHVGLDPGLVDEHQTSRIVAPAMIASAAAHAERRSGPVQGRTVFFFEPQSLAPQEQPDRIVRDADPTRGEFVLQPVQRQMGRLTDPFQDKGAMRIEQGLRCPPILPGLTEPVAR